MASLVQTLDSQRVKTSQDPHVCHALRRAILCSIVPCIVFDSMLLVLSLLTSVVLVCTVEPPLPGWSVKGRFTVKSQAAVLLRGGVRDTRGSEGSVVLVHSLQPDARSVVPDSSLCLHLKAFQAPSTLFRF